MRAFRFVLFFICLCYSLGFFPFMLFGNSFHGYTWDTGQISILAVMWLMSIVCSWLYYPGNKHITQTHDN